jgi:dTMP kinase
MAEAAVKRTPGRGRFISFEGGEGAGKSTQIKMLAEHFDAVRLRTIVTREPGGTPGGEIIGHLVRSGIGRLLGAEAEALLLAAARDEHARAVITPALNQGTWVLCTGFADAARACQGRLGKVAPAVLNAMERVTTGDLKPDLTIILDVPAEVGLQRAAGKRCPGAGETSMGAEDVQFHREVREAYRQIAASEPERCVLIDACADANIVAADIWAVLRDRFFAGSTSNLAHSA